MSALGASQHIGRYAIIFGILYWPFETLVHLFIFSQGTFLELFFPEIHEVWMRLLISASFIAFGIYANQAIAQQRGLNFDIQQQRNQLRRVIDSAHDAYISIDSNSIILDWNPSAEKLFGWSRTEAIGSPLIETIIPERFHQGHQKGMKVYLKDGSGPWLYRTLTTTARDRGGKEFPVEMSIVPINSGNELTFYAFLHRATDSESIIK
jgi:PAS domain S-box-containing protein